MNVQAGVALHLMDEQPEQARTALTAIKQASGEALQELRSVLDILRQGDGDDEQAPPRTPTPGLGELDTLVERATAAGIDVRAAVEGTRHALPVSVDTTAYRIVQEALTNVARHAGATAAATIRVDYGDDDIVVEVEDDGRGSTANGVARRGGGNGIPNMRERAEALGGQLDAGPRPGGGFRVRAWLPVRDREREDAS
jgi:signal transduction histidine kinase